MMTFTHRKLKKKKKKKKKSKIHLCLLCFYLQYISPSRLKTYVLNGTHCMNACVYERQDSTAYQNANRVNDS